MHYRISLKLIIWINLLNIRPEHILQQFPDKVDIKTSLIT